MQEMLDMIGQLDQRFAEEADPFDSSRGSFSGDQSDSTWIPLL